MKNTEELLKYSIQQTKRALEENGYNNKEDIETFLGQSMYYLYQDGSATGFSREASSVLEGVSKDEILNVFVNDYIQKIIETEPASIRDDFQNILKTKIENDGKDKTTQALRAYMENGDVNDFPESSRSDIVKYSSDSLAKAMGIIFVSRALSSPIVKLDKSDYNIGEKSGYSALDFATISNGKFSIKKIIDLMEVLRSGKLEKEPEK